MRRFKAYTPMGRLPKGTIAAINLARWRVPDDAPEAAKTLADQALQTMADVMDGTIPAGRAQSALAAARMIREEVCGAPAKTVKVDGKLGLAALLGEMEGLEAAEKAAQTAPAPAGAVSEAPVPSSPGVAPENAPEGDSESA